MYIYIYVYKLKCLIMDVFDKRDNFFFFMKILNNMELHIKILLKYNLFEINWQLNFHCNPTIYFNKDRFHFQIIYVVIYLLDKQKNKRIKK